MCGFIGVVGSNHAVQDIYNGLVAIQHRGQDAAGIMTYDGRFHLKKGEGLVREIFQRKNIDRLQGGIGVGHVRYPTVGTGGAEDAQPFWVNFPYGIVMAHNGNVANYREAREALLRDDHRHLRSGCDVEVVLNVFAAALSRHGSSFDRQAYHAAVADVYRKVKGAYSVVGFVAGEGLFAFRDPFGIKPIVVGRRREADGRWAHAAASESVVLTNNDFELLATPRPGEAVFVDLEGTLHREQVAPADHHPCVFEYVYFARPDSLLEGVSVYRSRLAMGRKLAETFRRSGLSADVVIPIPDSARNAALSMAQALDLPYREAMVKNRYVGRTFIMKSDDERRKSIRHKLNAIDEEFRGKDVLLVDDSIVRGNTSKQIVQMARHAGARKVIFASMSPPLVHPCVYGIDMSTRREFIARGRSVEEVAREIGADAVLYQDLDDLVASVRELSDDMPAMCHACFSGEYPTGDVTADLLLQIERSRLLEQA